ncbi:MAG: YicC/YloC family endoribonuclease [Nitrospinota bacterium]|nr:YicC/YloC family endoribonuclease [Nitrospinota bacterium]
MSSKSMTGYGNSVLYLKNGDSLCVEVRSVNHRFLEISIKGPRWTMSLENEIREKIKSCFFRGKFDVFITHIKDSVQKMNFDSDSIKILHKSLQTLQKKLNIKGEIDLNFISQFQEFLKPIETEIIPDKIRRNLIKTLTESLLNLRNMRIKEGKELHKDVATNLKNIKINLGKIQDFFPKARLKIQKRAELRIQKFFNKIEIDPSRLEQELVIAGEKGDISEELSRFHSHINQFERTLSLNSPMGRKLDFLTQEMNREINTTAAKSIDSKLSKHAIDIKTFLEKIREQVQNIE